MFSPSTHLAIGGLWRPKYKTSVVSNRTNRLPIESGYKQTDTAAGSSLPPDSQNPGSRKVSHCHQYESSKLKMFPRIHSFWGGCNVATGDLRRNCGCEWGILVMEQRASSKLLP